MRRDRSRVPTRRYVEALPAQFSERIRDLAECRGTAVASQGHERVVQLSTLFR